LRLSPDGTRLDFTDWEPARTPHNLDVLRVARAHHLVVMPVLSNAEGAVFDPVRVHHLLADPARQDSLAREIRDWLLARGFHGLNVDFENLPADDDRKLPGFLARVHRAFAPAGLTLSFDLEPEDFEADPRALAEPCDFVVLMAYDEHGAAGPPGPLCSVEWYRRMLDRALQSIPANRLVLGMASFSYDWSAGGPRADALTYQQALLTARDNRPGESPASVIDYDEVALNPTFNYMDLDAQQHEVWMLDATTAANQWTLAAPRGLRGASIWVLGAEDPALWSVLDQVRSGGRLANVDSLDHPSFPYGVEFQGDGEILKVAESWLTRGFLTRDWQPLPQAIEALSTVGTLYALFFGLELIGAAIAFRLDREKPKLLWWLFWQRFVYRQLMYAVVLRSLRTALFGMRAGWGRLERKGTATAGA
jgi:hypothetical protein